MEPRYRPAHDKGYLSEDTIAAIATAVGGAVSLVRMSGPRSFDVLKALIQGTNQELKAMEARKLHLKLLHAADGSRVDQALVVKFTGPNSFTGEDSVEFHLHGGAYIASKLMEALSGHGVRQALPGEFSFRAVRNGKMSLSQAEATADLIAAANDGALELALDKMSGAQGKMVADIAEGLRSLAMLSEAGIDFSDQDISEVSLANLKGKLRSLIGQLRTLEESYDRGSRIQEGIRVAFVGLPNAGKSSFFNALLGEDRSIVSEIAGTTRDVIRERLTLRGRANSVTLRLEDTAGLRSAHDVVERMGVERTERSASEADLLLLIVDPSAGISGVFEQWDRLGRPSEKTIGVLAKKDLCAAEQLDVVADRLAPLGIQQWVRTSAVYHEGISEAAETIVGFCQHWVQRSQGEVLLTRLDHLEAVRAALAHLERAEQVEGYDLFAADLRQALHALSPLVGATVADDILGRIFSSFCIGK